MKIQELDTPSIVIDLDVMERNLAKAADYAKAHGLRLRPHTKTHKIPALGRRQLELGAAGLSVAKPTEAEVMAASGVKDLLIAYPVVGARKLERVTALAKKTGITIALDSVEVARPIAEAARRAGVEIGILTEVDVGLHRVGVQPGPELVTLVEEVSRMEGLRWRGVAFYPGHIKDFGAESQRAFETLRKTVGGMIAELREAGFDPEIVSGGSTPLLWHSHEIPEVNEIRPGTYIFGDLNTVNSGACTMEECAATILATVVSVKAGRMIIDGGSKTFSSDRLGGSAEVTFGRLVEAPEARFHKMNEEHGFVELAGVERKFSVGERVHVVPNHICVAVNLHEVVYGVRGDEVECQWKVEGRGKLY